MAHNGIMAGGPAGVYSTRLARFLIFVIIAIVILLTYQIWTMTKRCTVYESRLVSYDAQFHRLHLEKSIADKRADSYRRQVSRRIQVGAGCKY